MRHALPGTWCALMAVMGLVVADQRDRKHPKAQLQCVNATSTTVTVQWSAVPQSDLYYVAIVRHTLGGTEQVRALNTVPSSRTRVTLTGLAPEMPYTLRLRSHPSSAPSIVWGWRNATGPTTTCRTTASVGRPPVAAPKKKPLTPVSRFTRMYRVSEMTSEVDFLRNHDSADLPGPFPSLGPRHSAGGTHFAHHGTVDASSPAHALHPPRPPCRPGRVPLSRGAGRPRSIRAAAGDRILRGASRARLGPVHLLQRPRGGAAQHAGGPDMHVPGVHSTTPIRA